MHTELISTPIRSSIFQTEDPVTNVRTPSIDAIIVLNRVRLHFHTKREIEDNSVRIFLRIEKKG
jgi:hypothetical protein